jgi:ABC-type dipeptide/oligopeptide/nickel transport system permease component
VASFVVILPVYQLRWFPFAALHSVPLPTGAVARLLDHASHLVLPELTIASVRCRGFAYRERSMTVPLVDTDYVAAGRGIPERRVIGGYVLRVALPGVATLAAMLLVDSLCGDILVERC